MDAITRVIVGILGASAYLIMFYALNLLFKCEAPGWAYHIFILIMVVLIQIQLQVGGY